MKESIGAIGVWLKRKVLHAIIPLLAMAGNLLIGNWSLAMTTLVIFILLDIASGLIRAICQKELDSKVSWRGMTKKVVIFLVVVLAAQMDVLLGSAPTLRDATVVFYCINEALSTLENVAAVTDVPAFLRDVLKQLNPKKFTEEDDG